MRQFRKVEIERRAAYAGLCNIEDVARISRDKRVITMRHVWNDRTDARAWDVIRRELHTTACELARRTRNAVSVYAKDGHMIDHVYPDTEFQY